MVPEADMFFVSSCLGVLRLEGLGFHDPHLPLHPVDRRHNTNHPINYQINHCIHWAQDRGTNHTVKTRTDTAVPSRLTWQTEIK